MSMAWKKGDVLKATGLYLLIIPFLNALNVTGYENSQIQGHFGASSVELMYASLVPVFVMMAGLPLALELAKLWPLKSMMLGITIMAIAVNTCSAYVPNLVWFTACRSVLTFLTIFGIVAALIPIVVLYNPKLNMAIMYGIVQFIIQGSSLLYKYAGTQFAALYDWRSSLWLLNLNFLICILLAFVFLRKNVALGKAPFRFDFTGWAFLILFFAPLLFLSAEGQNREWFSDGKVTMAASMVLVVIGAYMLYARNARDPLIKLEVFRYSNVAWGTFFFFLIGVANSTGSVITGFMAGILGFDEIYMARTHLYMLAGLVVSVPLCTYMIYKRVYLGIAAIFGFLGFTGYHLLMYFRFYPGIGEADFILPFVLKGVGIGFLYVLSALYISENVPKPLSTSRMMSGVIARIIIATILGGAVISTWVNNGTVLHKTGISQQLTPIHHEAYLKQENTRAYYMAEGLKPAEADKMADNPLQSDIKKPATLLAYKDLYLVMAAISFLPILLVLLFRMGRRPLGKVEVEPLPI